MTVTDGAGAWQRLSREEALAALGLDIVYERADGSRLSDTDGRTVWDFLGGYGSTFFGHNHPALTDALMGFVAAGGVVHAQASAQRQAAELRDALTGRLQAALGRRYVVMLGSTGAEAVETAARHWQLAYERRRVAMAADIRLPPDGMSVQWTGQARALLARLGLPNGPESIAEIARHNRGVLDTPAIWIALERGFHGKTARALALTHDPEGRFGPRPADSARFVPPEATAVKALLDEITRPLLSARRVDGGAWQLRTIDWTPAVAFIMEPVQGEGGIHPIEPACARAWQEACAAHGVPLIADEIQSGLGRTGAFVCSAQLGIVPDCLLLGKSLGGGLVKVSAAAFASDRYVRSFSLAHSSTFAGDGLSSCVALRALRLFEDADAARVAARRGATLMARLQTLIERYPDVLAEVRGRGLMIGLEWRRMPFDRSPALRFLQRYGWLGYAMSGYLLRAHGIRVAPTLSGADTLRIEPAFDVPDEALHQLLTALDQLCALLRTQAAAEIVGPCMQLLPVNPPAPAGPPAVLRNVGDLEHVAFIGHFIDGDGVAQWDRSFRSFGTAGCEAFLERLRPFAEPLVCHRDRVLSITGDAVGLTFIGIPVSAQQCARAVGTPAHRELRDLVRRAVDMAVAEGCSAVGLGGHCSILTRNGRDVARKGIAVTTGNGYTVGAALLAMKEAAQTCGVPWRGGRGAVVGARGNIGSVLARLMAHEVGSLVLVGREGHRSTLEAMAGSLMVHLLVNAPGSPIATALAGAGLSAAEAAAGPAGTAFFRHVQHALGPSCPVRVSAEPSDCAGAELIATVSNSPETLLQPEHLGDQPTIIVDLAVPGDVDAAVQRRRPNVRVIRGGVVRTPCNPDWYVAGIPLAPGEMFACMCETVLMGLDRQHRHGSLGRLHVSRVLETLAIARRHGFTSIRTLREHDQHQPMRAFA